MQSNLNGYYTKRHNLGEIVHNHRKIHINEVIWDWDLDNKDLDFQIMDFVSAKLIKDKISHSIWKARTHKIHAFFELEKYDFDIRKIIRKTIVKHYAEPYTHFIDFGCCSEKRMIRDFYSIHEITKQQNLCVYDYGDGKLNKVPKFILDMALRQSNIMPQFADTIKLHKDAEKTYADFIAYCLKTRFDKDGFRNNVYFKNIAIAVFRLQLSQEITDKIFCQITLNCKGKTIRDLSSWLKWSGQQKHLVKVNWDELKRGMFYP